MPLLPVLHIMPEHLAELILPVSFIVLGAHVSPGPAVVFAFGLGEGDLAGVAVPQLDPGFQDLPGSGGGLVDHPEKELAFHNPRRLCICTKRRSALFKVMAGVRMD